MSKTMAIALHGLQGGWSFERFVRATHNEWTKLAQATVARCGYSGLDPEDLVQVMLLSVWRHLELWDARRGPLERFILWHAVVDARRAINQSKGLHRDSPRRAPSMYVVTEDIAVLVGAWEDSPEEAASAHEVARQHLEAASPLDRLRVLYSLQHGSIHRGVERLSPAVRQRLDLDTSERRARAVLIAAFNRTLARGKDQEGASNGYETKSDEARGRVGRGCADGQGRREACQAGLPGSGAGLRSDGRPTDGATGRRRTRPRRVGSQPGDLVPSRIAC